MQLEKTPSLHSLLRDLLGSGMVDFVRGTESTASAKVIIGFSSLSLLMVAGLNSQRLIFKCESCNFIPGTACEIRSRTGLWRIRGLVPQGDQVLCSVMGRGAKGRAGRTPTPGHGQLPAPATAEEPPQESQGPVRAQQLATGVCVRARGLGGPRSQPLCRIFRDRTCLSGTSASVKRSR